jgi:uncharacterized protein
MILTHNIPQPLRGKGIEKHLQKIFDDNDVIFLGIFGSFVRGEEKKGSDIDLLVEYRKGSRRSLLDLVALEEKISELFGRQVDLLTPGGISPYLRDEILNSVKVIYEGR